MLLLLAYLACLLSLSWKAWALMQSRDELASLSRQLRYHEHALSLAQERYELSQNPRLTRMMKLELKE